MSELLDFDEMSVSRLRKECYYRLIPEDGTRPMLIARLVTHDLRELSTEFAQVRVDFDDPEGTERSEMTQRLTQARHEGAIQVCNAKRDFLTDKREELKSQLEAIEAELGIIEYECMDRMEESDHWCGETEKDTKQQVKALALAFGPVASQGFSEIMRIDRGAASTDVRDVKMGQVREIDILFIPELVSLRSYFYDLVLIVAYRS